MDYSDYVGIQGTALVVRLLQMGQSSLYWQSSNSLVYPVSSCLLVGGMPSTECEQDTSLVMAGPACGDAQITLSLGRHLVALAAPVLVHVQYVRSPTMAVPRS